MKEKDILVLGNEKISVIKEIPDTIKVFYKGKLEGTKTTPIIFKDDFSKNLITSIKNNYVANKFINKTDKLNRIKNSFLQEDHMNFLSITFDDKQISVKGYTYDHFIELAKMYNILYFFTTYYFLYKGSQQTDDSLNRKREKIINILKPYLDIDDVVSFGKEITTNLSDKLSNTSSLSGEDLLKLRDELFNTPIIEFTESYKTEFFNVFEQNRDYLFNEFKNSLMKLNKLYPAKVQRLLNELNYLLNSDNKNTQDIPNILSINFLTSLLDEQIFIVFRERYSDQSSFYCKNIDSILFYNYFMWMFRNNIFYELRSSRYYFRTVDIISRIINKNKSFKDISVNDFKLIDDITDRCLSYYKGSSSANYIPDLYKLNEDDINNMRFDIINKCISYAITLSDVKLNKYKIISVSKLFQTTFNQFDCYSNRLNEISTCIKNYVDNRHVTKRVPISAEYEQETEFLANSLSKLTLDHEIFINSFSIILNKFKDFDNTCISELSGDLLRYFYCYKNYAKPETGALWNSCMRYANLNPKMDGYAKNPDSCKMLTLFDKNELVFNNKYLVRARGILWVDVKGNKYVDRLFFITDDDARQLAEYAIANNYFVLDTCTNKFYGGYDKIIDRSQIKEDIRFNNQLLDLPYIDTLCDIEDSAYVLKGNNSDNIFHKIYGHQYTGNVSETNICLIGTNQSSYRCNKLRTKDLTNTYSLDLIHFYDNSKFVDESHIDNNLSVITLKECNILGNKQILPLYVNNTKNLTKFSIDIFVDLLKRFNYVTKSNEIDCSLLQELVTISINSNNSINRYIISNTISKLNSLIKFNMISDEKDIVYDTNLFINLDTITLDTFKYLCHLLIGDGDSSGLIKVVNNLLNPKSVEKEILPEKVDPLKDYTKVSDGIYRKSEVKTNIDLDYINYLSAPVYIDIHGNYYINSTGYTRDLNSL